jgi:hypothetical protein
MSKLLLPVLVGVFVGAFAVELVRRNNPELGDALVARAKRLANSMRNAGRAQRSLTTSEGREATWKHSG